MSFIQWYYAWIFKNVIIFDIFHFPFLNCQIFKWIISYLLEYHEIDLMAFVARCFSLAFSSLFLYVLTQRFDFVCSWLCVISHVFWFYWRLHMLLQVWTCLLHVSYLWQFQTVWVLDTGVLWQPRQVLMETDSLLLEMMLFYLQEM